MLALSTIMVIIRNPRSHSNVMIVILLYSIKCCFKLRGPAVTVTRKIIGQIDVIYQGPYLICQCNGTTLYSFMLEFCMQTGTLHMHIKAYMHNYWLMCYRLMTLLYPVTSSSGHYE